MPARPNDVTVTPAEGGRLRPALSLHEIGWANYVEKVNFRRVKEREQRREGWVLFRPNTGLPQGVQAVPSNERILLLAQLTRPNMDRAMIAATRTHVFKFDYATGTWTAIGTGLSINGRRWQVEDIDGYLVFNNGVDLPFTARVEESTVTPLRELREIGVSRAGIMTEQNGYLVFYDITEIQSAQLNAWMNGGTPYGIVPDNLCNRVAYKVQWGEAAQPHNWAPLFTVTMPAASATITLPFASAAFVAGQTRVGVVNAGPNGGMLGGQTAYKEGVLVTAVVGKQITLEVTTNADLTYPRDVTVMRWSDRSTLSGYAKLQDDSSEIIWARKLGSRMIIYRRTGMWRGTYIGNPKKPFEFLPILENPNVPAWGEAVATLGDFHIYPAVGGHFYAFDGVSEPEVFDLLDDVHTVFTAGLTASSDVFSAHNPLTKEIWFCRPGFVVALDYEKKTVSTIDAEIHAAAFVLRPESNEQWFVMAIEGTIFTYGLVKNGVEQVLTYLRNGVNPGGRIKSGLISFRDRVAEKDLDSYLLHLASGTPQVTLRVKLYGAFDERIEPELLLQEDMAGPTYYVDTFYRAIYFQDEISITESGDAPIAVTARTFTAAKLRTDTPRKNA